MATGIVGRAAVPAFQDYNTYGTDDWYVANNPCPAGWRLPTNSEFAAAINRTANLTKN
jgi:hypothetical protein